MFLNNIVLLIIMILISMSCSTVQTKIDATKKYKLDLVIKNKEITGVGMVTLLNKDLYTIMFESPGRMDFFTFRTCSREIAIEDARRGLDRKEVLINYRPNEIEKNTACPVQVNAFSESGINAAGFIDFENTRDTLPANLTCGDTVTRANGTGVCQGRIGLIERIEFETEVIVSPDVGCDKIKSENGNLKGKVFTFNIDRDYCLFVFKERKDLQRTMRMTTYGYEDILVVR